MADNQDAIELQRRARRRLVGAIALVVFVVIVLPIVFDREPKPITQDLTIQIPSQDSGRFSSRVLPTETHQESPAAPGGERKAADAAKTAPESFRAADSAPGKAQAAAKSEKVEESVRPAEATGRPEPAKSEPAKAQAGVGTKVEEPKRAAPAVASSKLAPSEPAKSTDSKAVEAKVAETKTTGTKSVDAKPGDVAQAAGESFAIALGLFRNPDNVRKVRAWVTSAGYKSFTEDAPPDASGAKGTGVKVLAGPFTSKDAAERAREKLKAKGIDVGAIVQR